jgi:hypothetical protein
MKWKLRGSILSATGMVLMTGLIASCTGPDNPKIAEVPNLKQIASEVKKGPEKPKGMPKGYGEGKAYRKQFDKVAD